MNFSISSNSSLIEFSNDTAAYKNVNDIIKLVVFVLE